VSDVTRIEEKITAGMVDRLAVIVNNRDTDYKVTVMCKLIGDRFGYEASFKANKQFLTLETGDLDRAFDEAKKAVKEVLSGRKELNAILS
jgi:hypothetical protein